jgi:hypothetical protein
MEDSNFKVEKSKVYGKRQRAKVQSRLCLRLEKGECNNCGPDISRAIFKTARASRRRNDVEIISSRSLQSHRHYSTLSPLTLGSLVEGRIAIWPTKARLYLTS